MKPILMSLAIALLTSSLPFQTKAQDATVACLAAIKEFEGPIGGRNLYQRDYSLRLSDDKKAVLVVDPNTGLTYRANLYLNRGEAKPARHYEDYTLFVREIILPGMPIYGGIRVDIMKKGSEINVSHAYIGSDDFTYDPPASISIAATLVSSKQNTFNDISERIRNLPAVAKHRRETANERYGSHAPKEGDLEAVLATCSAINSPIVKAAINSIYTNRTNEQRQAEEDLRNTPSDILNPGSHTRPRR